ncbi:MAG: dienelactone hydrolase [Hymenobacter sp.]
MPPTSPPAGQADCGVRARLQGVQGLGPFWAAGRVFAEKGFVFIKLNLSHNGVVVGGTGDLEDLEAFGHNNFSLELDDLGQLLDALHTPGATPCPPPSLDLRRLCLVGHSRGGALVLLKAAEDPRVTAVATWAAVADLHPRWPADVVARVAARRRTLRAQRPHRPANCPCTTSWPTTTSLTAPGSICRSWCPACASRLLLIHGDQDETVPLAAVHAAAGRPARRRGAGGARRGPHVWRRAPVGRPGPTPLGAAHRRAHGGVLFKYELKIMTYELKLFRWTTQTRSLLNL